MSENILSEHSTVALVASGIVLLFAIIGIVRTARRRIYLYSDYVDFAVTLIFTGCLFVEFIKFIENNPEANLAWLHATSVLAGSVVLINSWRTNQSGSVRKVSQI